MSELPTGTVTFLFTDIEGSTRLLEGLGDDYADVLEEHRRALRTTFAGLGGVEVDTQGDAFFFAFERARDAVEAAAAGQLALAAHDAYRRFRQLQHTLRLQGERFARIETAAVEAEASAVRALWVLVLG